LGLSRPLLPLNYVLKAQYETAIRYGLVNGMSSGGTFAAIVMKKIG
jgi:hypothetical protein